MVYSMEESRENNPHISRDERMITACSPFPPSAGDPKAAEKRCSRGPVTGFPRLFEEFDTTGKTVD
jgi:hypothetical protein